MPARAAQPPSGAGEKRWGGWLGGATTDALKALQRRPQLRSHDPKPIGDALTLLRRRRAWTMIRADGLAVHAHLHRRVEAHELLHVRVGHRLGHLLLYVLHDDVTRLIEGQTSAAAGFGARRFLFINFS